MNKLTFITGNAGKAKYLGDYFHMPIEHHKLDLREIQSLDLREIVEDKARHAFEILGSPALVEDIALTFEALKALPGPLIKWFEKALSNEGLCLLVNSLKNREAHAEVLFAFCDEKGVRTFHGETRGVIADKPRGEAGFGWDPIFIPAGHEKTWAEMSADEKHQTSMRKMALEKLSVFLKDSRLLHTA